MDITYDSTLMPIEAFGNSPRKKPLVYSRI